MSTVITNKLVIDSASGDVVLDGLDFTANGYVEVKHAAALTIKNCRVFDLDTTGATKNYWLRIFGDIPVKLVIENCFFGNNATSKGSVYNLLEPTAKLMDGSSISNCYFKAECCTHNSINIYGAEENADIFVNYNVFEMSAGTIRIGVKGSPVCRIYMTGNTVLADNPAYSAEDQGLACIQPYNKQTTTFANMTVVLKNNKLSSEQLMYGWYGNSDLPLTDDVMPKIIIGGKPATIPIYH